MASVYKKQITRELPDGAEIVTRKGEQIARWRVGNKSNGKLRTAPVAVGKQGELRIRTEAGTYTAKYRDGSGLLQETATGCRDKTAAEAVLGDLVRRADKVRSGLRSVADNEAIDHQHTPLADVLAVYVEHLKAKGNSATHVADCERLAKRAFAGCGFKTLRELAGEPLERWLTTLSDGGSSPRTRNSYLQAVRGFCRWCVQSGRLQADATKRIAKLDIATDVRRNRRSLSAVELERLLYAARLRPLAERGRETVPNDDPDAKATWILAPLAFDLLPAAVERARGKLADKPQQIAKLEAVGRERALAYKTLVLTGLRKGELASLSIGSLVLDSATPFLVLKAADAKNRKQAEIPLRSDLAAELTEWANDKREAFTGRSGATDGVISLAGARGEQLPLDTPLFSGISGEFLKVLNRDLAAAGIPKSDERGRTVDIHAMRHTYGSLLSAGGVAPRTAQAAMRHSSIDLTMNVYTDPKVLDIAGALDSLPALPLGATPSEHQRNVATGTDARNLVAPMVAPNSDKRCISVATGDNWAEKSDCTRDCFHPGKQSVSRETERVADGIRTHDLRNHNPTF